MDEVEWALCDHEVIAKGTELDIKEEEELKVGESIKLEICHNNKGGREGGRGGRRKTGERKERRKDFLLSLPNANKLTRAPSVPTHMSWHNLVNDLLHAAYGTCLSSCTSVTFPPAILMRWSFGNSLPLGRVPQREMELTLKTECRERDPCTYYGSAGSLHVSSGTHSLPL